MKKLYLLSQAVNTGYDTYYEAVVSADDEEEARHINPGGFHKWHDGAWYFQYSNGTEEAETDRTWCLPSEIKVKEIGTSLTEKNSGVICSSFNAG